MKADEIQVKISRRVQKLQKLVGDGMRGTDQANPVRKWFRKVAVRYGGYVLKMFRINSRGGGDWPDLAKSTKLARARALRPQRNKGEAQQSVQQRATTRRKKFDKLVEKMSRLGGHGSIASIRRSLLTGMRFSILDDTHTLYNALSPGSPGNEIRDIPNGIRFGFTDAQHGSDRLTIGKLARFHHDGGGRLPKRTILHQPDDATKQGFRKDLDIAARELEAMLRE